MTALPAGATRHARILLPANLPLLDAVIVSMSGLAWTSATLQIFGGPLARATYHCSVLTPTGPRWIDYGPARVVADPAALIIGCATFGRTGDGGPALHCHAILSGPDGLVGGHLSPERCLIGPEGLIAHAVSGPEAGFSIQRDPVSSFDLLAPA